MTTQDTQTPVIEEKQESFGGLFLKAFSLSVLLAGDVLLAGLMIFVGNPLDFSFTLRAVLVGLGVVAALLGAVVLGVQGIGILLSRKYGAWIPVWMGMFFLWLGIGVWLQGSVNWGIASEFGLLAEYQKHWGLAILEAFSWGILLGLVYWFREWLWPDISLIVGIILGCQLLLCLGALCNYSESKYPNKWVELESGNTYQFSKQENIIVLILDSFGENNFQEISQAFPAPMSEGFRDFHHFSRCISPYPFTATAIPMLFTGSSRFGQKSWDWNNSLGNMEEYAQDIQSAYGEDTSLLKRTKEKGYEIYVSSPSAFIFPLNQGMLSNEQKRGRNLHLSWILAEDLLPAVGHRFSPLFFKASIHQWIHHTQWQVYEFLDTFGDSSARVPKTASDEASPSVGGTSRSKDTWDTFPIPPDPFFTEMPQTCPLTDAPVLQVYLLNSVHDEDRKTPKRAEQYFQKAKTDMVSTLQFLKKLKENGVYDSSYILILGDHGNHSESERIMKNPMFLFKRPREHHDTMQHFTQPILLRDIAPTILSEMGISTSKPYSFWSFSDEQKQEREAIWQEITAPKP